MDSAPDLGPDFEVYRVDVPFIRDWPIEQVREHLARVLHEAAERARTVESPYTTGGSQAYDG